MTTEVEDVNAGAGSSTAQGATVDSPTTTTTTADSSPQGDKQPGSISEALEKVALEMPPEETEGAGAEGDQGDSNGSTAETSPTSEAESGETESDADAGPKDGQQAKEGNGTTGADVPFHTRPEWQSAMKVLNTLPDKGAAIKPILREAFQRETRVQEQLRAIQPQAEATMELQRIVGGEKEFAAMKNVVRGFAAGDPAVLPVLRQMVQQMERTTGEVITSTDLIQRQQKLQQQFDEGLIDQAEFQEQSGLLKEVEKTRAGKKQVETQLQTTAQTQQQQQQAEAIQQRTTALNSWESDIRQRDPDFGNVTDVNDPKHGETVADQVFDAISLKFMQKPNASTEELLQAAKNAYQRAKGAAPKPTLRTSRVATSQSSSVTGKQKPRTLREAMDNVKLE